MHFAGAHVAKSVRSLRHNPLRVLAQLKTMELKEVPRIYERQFSISIHFSMFVLLFFFFIWCDVCVFVCEKCRNWW